MKAHKKGLYTPREASKEAIRLSEEEYAAAFKKASDELVAQCTATVLWTLAQYYGWREKRLRQFCDALHDTKELMCKPSKMHRRFSPLECEEEIKQKYGIDVRSEFKAEVIEKP